MRHMQSPHPHHLEARFHLFDAKHGGRTTPLESGARPLHRVHDNYLSIARHVYPGTGAVSPGDTADVQAWFVTPEIYPNCLWIGRQIDVIEGDKVVGTMTVTKILNEVLAGSAASYLPTWTAPPLPQARQTSWLTLSVAGAMYAVFAGAVIAAAIEIFTPCVSNFEGGCSMGKGLLAMASLIPALAATGMGFAMRGMLASRHAIKRYATRLTWLLAGAPAAFVFYISAKLFGF